MPRLGRVEFHCSYVVDLDDPDMVETAREALHEDIYNIVETHNIEDCFSIFEDPDADPSDIDEYLMPVTVAHIHEPEPDTQIP